jgi:hypothetical protein
MNNCDLPLICINPFNLGGSSKNECNYFIHGYDSNCKFFINENFCSCQEAKKEYFKNLLKGE